MRLKCSFGRYRRVERGRRSRGTTEAKAGKFDLHGSCRAEAPVRRLAFRSSVTTGNALRSLTLLGCKWPHGCCAFQTTEAFLFGCDIRPRTGDRGEFLGDLNLENGKPTVAEACLGGRQIELP